MTEPSAYVREIETYLCRRNGGHLVRVVGPAFEMVRGWAEGGLPLRVAFRGIDRCCARLEARGTRRRPVRIEFCEADVLDAFDEWRRAVGVGGALEDGAAPDDVPPRKPALTAHIERSMARLAYVRGASSGSTALHHALDAIIRELEELVAAAPRARGEARSRLVARLEALDAALVEAAIAALDSGRAAALRQEAAEELAPFAARMPPEARDRAQHLAFVRAVRQALGLPSLRYE